MFVIYPSPHINELNSQVTDFDIYRTKWIFDYKNENDGLCGYFGYGVTKRLISSFIPYRNYLDIRYAILESDKSLLPNHFGYGQYATLKSVTQDKMYLILSIKDIIAYSQVYTNLERISFNDIITLNNDSTTLLIYNNGESCIYYTWR
jgi:hypothetical protein